MTITATAALLSTACSSSDPEGHSFALIGDAPYGTVAMALFPQLVAQVNADDDVEFVAHAGDIRGQDTDCSDEILRATFDLYQQFDDAFWLTPGDNDWFDCHREGGFLPTERLSFLRSLFYADPTTTTGGSPITVRSQARDGDPAHEAFVENTSFTKDCVTYGAVHVIGFGDGIEPWAGFAGDPAAGLAPGDQPDLRLAGNAARREAALAWIDRIFDLAERDRSSAVFLLMQAEPVDDANYVSLREKVLERAGRFSGPVLLAHGDVHTYVETADYAGLANLDRLQTAGDDQGMDEWIEVTVDCGADEVFSWERREFELVR